MQVGELVKAAMEETRVAGRSKRLTVECLDCGDQILKGDEAKIHQALANLLDNAVRFSPHGGVILGELRDRDDHYEISIYDQGSGMDIGQLDRLSRPFSHAAFAYPARRPGAGLGLPVARRIAEAHGGELRAESPPQNQPIAIHHFAGTRITPGLPKDRLRSPRAVISRDTRLNMGGRTVVALSGGVDSAVAAAITVAEGGAQAIGITLRLYDAPVGAGPRHRGSCCAPEDIDDARRVADQLDIPFYVLDASERFRASVIEPFIAAYREGQTPLPCAACNRTLKFGHLLQRARALSARLCTGHYARIEQRADGSYRLLRARDERRDQSYFLFGLRQDDLADLDFPLGERLKDEVRAMATKRGLAVAAKPDSQELCFLSGDYASLRRGAWRSRSHRGDARRFGGEAG